MERIFEGQTAIISGGMGDIGFATARELAKLGANVALCGTRTPDTFGDQIALLETCRVQVDYQRVDVADAVAVQRWIETVNESLGIATLIIANAAVTRFAGIHEITADEWLADMNINLNGAFYMTQSATACLLKEKLPGRVVFVGSWAATHVHAHMPAYSVSKAGMSMLCKCMALELAPHRILVNEIAPGYVNAGLSGRYLENNPDKVDEITQRVPIKQLMTAEEVAKQIVFLCHPENRQMTGSTLLMDGGLSLK
ncbi:beta-ketoacyl-ACP reductase [Parapedobacter pyrenivorans]|uniref:Beta-ketoacyl-ACP reductase n=1 Tax=Parapedobacter pyrenivorans TaxID=1305674 RepID=A0A917MHF4_9SPHI|nr:SDR family oxidoreductase [Parapedobacter pyrenivorans]GGH03811.1 beta-ketoacyl-ACP reductase [Parapedobacter pyrenivorans]